MIKNIVFIIFLCTMQLTPGSFVYTPKIYEAPKPYTEYNTTDRSIENKDRSIENFDLYQKSTKTVSPELKYRAEQARIEKENELHSLQEKKIVHATRTVSQDIALKENINKSQTDADILLKEEITLPKTVNNLTTTDRAIAINQTNQQQPSQEKSFQNLFTPLTGKSSSINLSSLMDLPTEIFDKFSDHINKMIFSILKKSMIVSPHTKIAQFSFADIIGKSFQRYLFLFLQLPIDLNTSTQTGQALNNFRMEIQILAEQIKKYNGKKYYTNPDQMLMLIKIINQFLKEASTRAISIQMSQKLDTVYEKAAQCCSLFQGQNMIFSSKNTPIQIFSFFKKSIDSTNNLPNLEYSYNIMQTIYGDQGYMDQILETWKIYQLSDLYKNKINRQYGAFITFLLIFENSIIAGANILYQTSTLYKITNPIPVTINITQD